MSVEIWSYLVYGLWFLLWVVLEFLGLQRKKTGVPWFTLSETAWALQKRFGGPVRVTFLAGLVTLTVHIVAGWP
jgi:hypothetical protein